MKKSQHGVTLIELVIVVSIISILAVLAVPSYQQHMRRSHRTDAMSALMRIAADQEKFYFQNSRYANTSELGTPTTENGWYTLSIGGNNATTYTAVAIAATGGPQYDDDDCRMFILNATGMRLAFDSNIAPADDCWR